MSKLYQKINGSAVPLSGGVGVVNNLTSTSTTDALSANQGRVLNEKIEALIDDTTTSNSTTYSSDKINDMIGDIETLLADL